MLVAGDRARAQPVQDPQSVERAAESTAGESETTLACLERTLAALSHIERNAHQATLIECWLDDLAAIPAG